MTKRKRPVWRGLMFQASYRGFTLWAEKLGGRLWSWDSCWDTQRKLFDRTEPYGEARTFEAAMLAAEKAIDRELDK